MTNLTKLEALELAKDMWAVIVEHNLRDKHKIKDENKAVYERIKPMVFQCPLCQFVAEQAGIAESHRGMNSSVCSEYCPCYQELHCLDEDDDEDCAVSDFTIWDQSRSATKAKEAANNIFDIITEAYELELNTEKTPK
jgi:hypothetical protein